MLQFATEKHLYRFCSTCRAPMRTNYFDGDVENFTCPNKHESMVSYKTIEGLRKYALKLFAPGMGAQEGG